MTSPTVSAADARAAAALGRLEGFIAARAFEAQAELTAMVGKARERINRQCGQYIRASRERIERRERA